MEIYKSKINKENKEVKLDLLVRNSVFSISLTEDTPNDIKNVFNKLIKESKKGEFKFELEESEDDLYFYLSKEYIKQLNNELGSVYKELKDYNLLEEKQKE